MNNLDVYCVTNKKMDFLENTLLKLVGVGKENFSNNYMKCNTKDNIYYKEKYYSEIMQQISIWFDEQNIDSNRFCESSMELILSIPEPNPHAYALRVLIELDQGPILFTMPGDPLNWNKNQLEAKVFAPGERYPSSYGFGVGTLLGKIRPNVSKSETNIFLAAHNAKLKSELGNGLITIKVRALQELKTANAIKENPSYNKFFSDITIDQSFEWISYKGLIDSMNFSCD